MLRDLELLDDAPSNNDLLGLSWGVVAQDQAL